MSDNDDIPNEKIIEKLSVIQEPQTYYDTRNKHKGFDTNLLNIGGNVLCAIDVKTTGPSYKDNDIYEICIQPVNSLFRPMKGINPFYTRIKLRRPDNVDFNKLTNRQGSDIRDANLKGVDSYWAVDHLENWVSKFNFSMNMRIWPLAYSWVKQQCFLEEWLGTINYYSIFSTTYRDIEVASLFANDRCELLRENYPYQPQVFGELVRKHRIDWVKEAGCLGNCRAIADIYRAMLTEFYF